MQVVSLTTGICLLTWLLCYATITWSASLTPVLHVTPGQLAAIASLGATIMMARSPASAVRESTLYCCDTLAEAERQGVGREGAGFVSIVL